MPEYLSPGVYVEEIATGPRPIEGVSTSTAGIVGPTERGPEPPRLVTSWLQFQQWYGGYIPNVSFLAYAVQGFFTNGGQRCFVARVINDGAAAPASVINGLTFMAIGRGTWGRRIRIKVDPATKSPAGEDWFRVSILYYQTDPAVFVDPTDLAQITNPDRREPDALEIFDNLTEAAGQPNSVETAINTASRLVRVDWGGNPRARLADQGFAALAGGGNGGAPTPPDFAGDMDPIGALPNEPLGRGRGLAALEAIDEISLLLAPDEVRAGMAQVTTDVINQCQRLRDRFALVSAPQGVTDTTAAGLTAPPMDTSYAAYYYPWIRVYDPSINDTRLIPPTGHICGIFARTDIERGVHKAPANEDVRGASDMEFPILKRVQDILNPRGINCIRDFRSDRRGIRLWGARTMSSDGQWKYVNVRRLFLFVEESIDEGTQWVVFEPNDEPLWASLRRSLESFLTRVWRSGALMGTTQAEAFFVKCDRTTMTQDDIDNGRLICYIGIAPVKPAEFVIFRISQKTAEAQA